MPTRPELLQDLIAKARAAGADAADAVLIESTALSLAVRLGVTEKLERAESHDTGLRVLVGRQQAVVSTTDLKRDALDELVERALAMARSVPEDPYCGLADPSQVAAAPPALDIYDPAEVAVEALSARARAAEDAARAVPGVTNSEGSEASWSRSHVYLAASNGFVGEYAVSRSGLGVAVLAGEGTAMERDYDFDSAVYVADQQDAASIGRNAGERAVKRLKPRKVGSAQVPIVFDPRVAGGLVRHLAGAINGIAIARGTSFLKDKMEQQILPAGMQVIDDPLRPRGLRSRPFDGEGIGGERRAIVDDGVLTTWLLDLRAARQLGLESTGHASRGTGGPPAPAPTNLYLEAGAQTPQELIGDIPSGLYVSELMGMGVNGVTGDYSRGASGFWIENGELAYPVSEVTVAGNLKDMLRNLAAANDLQFRYGTDAPTVRVDGMTVAGR
jgi:PmbA protein